MHYVAKLGFEFHCTLNTERKLFCACQNDSEEKKANTNICAVCMGLPGTLPSPINKEALKKAITLTYALKSKCRDELQMDRKHYVYYDLPKNYQLTQFYKPIGRGGVLLLKRGELVRLHDIHIEEDAGRTIAEEGCKLVDFNRAGTPLVEIVTEATEVEIEKLESFVVDLGESLREVVLAFSVSRCRMELGEFRADVNFSLMAGERKTERVEIKNLNSFRFMLKAVQCELQKHIALLEKNEVNRSGTFLYDVKSNQTVFTRLKEATSDYCYMPDPDIPSFPITTSLLESSKKQYDEKNEIFASLRTCFTEKELLDMYDKRIELFLYKSPVKDLRKSYLWLNRFLKLDDRSEREQIKLAYNFLSATERHKLSTSDSKLLFETLRKEKTIEIELLIEQLLERKTEATIDLKELVEYYIQRESELTEKIRSGKTNAVNRLLGIILSENRVDAKGLREFLLSYFDIRA